jgi:type I restriction enzyme R subunit
VDVDKSFLRKTARLVQEHTHVGGIGLPGPAYELTPEVLRSLAHQDKPDTVKVFNLLISIRKLVEEKVDRMPYLLSIGERAEAIAEAFEQHLTDAQKALLDLTGVVEDLEKAEELRNRSDLPDEAFAAYFFLEGRGVGGAEKIARESSEAFEGNPHWKESDEQERRVRIALYRALKGSQVKDMVEVVGGLLDLLRRASS